MDPIDILGDLLGGGKGGGSILTDMLGKARKRSSPSTNRPSSPRTGGGSSSRGRSGPARSSGSLEQQAEEL